MKSVGDLQRALGTGESEILELFQAASEEVYPWKKRQVQTDSTEALIGTGNDTIDRILGGGFPLGSVTEVVGERLVTSKDNWTGYLLRYCISSSGKTQLCLQLCLSVQKPGVDGGEHPIYLC